MSAAQIPQHWDAEADVVVVGFGGAGAVTAISAADEGASVLILEKAPRGQEGGNTRVSGQGYLNLSSTESAAAYLRALSAPDVLPEDMVGVWASEMTQNNDWFRSIGGDPHEHMHQPASIEFPELPGSESVHRFHHGQVRGFGNTWQVLRRAVDERSIDMRFSSPARSLIQHPESGEILGVVAEDGGRRKRIRAKRAVVLTCGGFQANPEMIREHLPGVSNMFPLGTPYNEGDGVLMAMEVGADLWHMGNFAGPMAAMKVPDFKTVLPLRALSHASDLPGGMIVVGPDGRRRFDEKAKTRHGRVWHAGQWRHLATTTPMYMVFDHRLFASGPLYDITPYNGWTRMIERYPWSADNSLELDKGWITMAASVRELAAAVDLDGPALEDAVERWNAHCSEGRDRDFGRELMLEALREAPFYAIELVSTLFNTQGGPRRNARGQIVRADDSPIPRLYGCGELGSIYGRLYQGAGNLGECFAFGRVCGRNAAAEPAWDGQAAIVAGS